MKKQETKEEKEARDAAGYARIPSRTEEFEEWESEQVWLEDEQFEPEKEVAQTAATDEKTRVMKEALEKAAEIRRSLEGRKFSDSTQNLIEDRQR